MKYSLIVVLVAAIAAVGFVNISLPSQTAHSHSGDFREWVKNPDYKQAAVNYFSARKSLRVPSDISDSEVRNGGHSQYFVNSSGDDWKIALEGLISIGATQRAEILRKAVAIFGGSGPSEIDSVRSGQLAEFTSEQDKKFDDLNLQYYALKENVAMLLNLYAVEHKRDFVATP